MSAEELVPSMVSCNMEPQIYRDWIMENKEEIIKLEKTVDRISEGSSADESEEVETEPPPVAVRRKVSFADAFGLDLVSVKEYDSRDTSRQEADGREAKEYYISCLFTIPALNQDKEVRLQQQKLELEHIELLPGSTTIRGIIRVLNLCFHKAVYIRVSLDGWQSHFELLAEYLPGSSDGETDCFSFHLVLTPPFQVEGVRVEFCLRYESTVGTFWANNGGMNYVVFLKSCPSFSCPAMSHETSRPSSLPASELFRIVGFVKSGNAARSPDASSSQPNSNMAPKHQNTHMMFCLFLLALVRSVEAFDAGDALALMLGATVTLVGICACLGWYARTRNGQF